MDAHFINAALATSTRFGMRIGKLRAFINLTRKKLDTETEPSMVQRHKEQLYQAELEVSALDDGWMIALSAFMDQISPRQKQKREAFRLSVLARCQREAAATQMQIEDNVDLRPECPLCKQRVLDLVPWGKGHVCRECAQKPVPKDSIYSDVQLEGEDDGA